jgi:hypothetical protein
MSYNTPVLFLIFNRPEITERVFNQLKKLQPKHLYIAADGPRADKESEVDKCNAARQIVLDHIDWDCEVKTLLRDTNLGCGKAVSEAITWFFEQVDEGIILEDDCLPHPSFFNYCSNLLEKYRENQAVMMICGTSYQPKALDKNSYYFSKYPHVWAWATWRSAWARYNRDISSENPDTITGVLNNTFTNPRECRFWQDNLNHILNGLDTWDYQLMYWMWKNNAVCATPWKNMIANIGFGPDATHTFDQKSNQASMQQHDMVQIIHPANVAVHKGADTYERYNVLITPLKQLIWNKVRSKLNKAFNINSPVKNKS